MTVAGRPGDDPAPAPRSAASARAAAAAWAGSLLVLALIAVSALLRTGAMADELVASWPRLYGRLGLAMVPTFALTALAVVAAIRARAGSRFLAGHRLPILIVAVAVVVRVALALLASAPLHGENAIVHEQALGVLEGTCCFGHRPLGYPIVLAGAYALLGVGPAAIETLNIAFAAATTWLVWDIGRVTAGRRVGAVAATTFAVLPSQVLMALVPLTEPLFTLLVAASVRAAIALDRRPALLAVVAGASLAGAQYVRATAAALAVPLAIVPWLAGWTLPRALGRALVIGAVFVVLLTPVVAYNLRAHGDVSLSTSAYGGWSLYVGTNREHAGQWNAEDAADLAGFPGSSWWDRSRYAGGVAMDRVLDDPAGSLAVLPTKFGTVWGDETYAATYALRGQAITREIRVGWLTSQLAWLALVVLAATGMAAVRRRPPPAALLIGLMVLLVAIIHLALEVHSRYHAYLVPLLCVLAALGVEAIAGWRHQGSQPRPDSSATS